MKDHIRKYDLICLGTRWSSCNEILLVLSAVKDHEYMSTSKINKKGEFFPWMLMNLSAEFMLISRLDDDNK